jgi:short-subunit dehydrogenase
LTTIRGAAALVTGAGNGIGRALARALHARGAAVALGDRDKGALDDIHRELASSGGPAVSKHVVDVAEPHQIEGLAKDVIAAHPTLDIVINNAGVALFGHLHELSREDIEWLMGVNFWGVVHSTRAFLPHLEARPAAHIVNVSSVFGLIAPPGQTAYCAAKFAVRGFSESLRHELEFRGTNVKLSVVHPGGIRTGIARSSRVGARMTDNVRRAESLERFESLTQTTPEQAAERIIKGIEANEPRILIGPDARRMDLVQRLMPARYWKTIQKAMERTIAKNMKPSA